MRAVLGFRDQQVAGRDRDDADGDVDEEDPVPAQVLREQPAGEGADRERERRDARPDADGHPPFLRREGGSDDRERRRVHQRRADALHDARHDQHVSGVREPAPQRGGGEDEDADHEDQAAAVGVGELAADQHQRREAERVARDDPLQLGEICSDVRLDRRQRHVHNGVVQHDHEEAERDGGERPPLPPFL